MEKISHSQRQMKYRLPEDKLGKKCARCILRRLWCSSKECKRRWVNGESAFILT